MLRNVGFASLIALSVVAASCGQPLGTSSASSTSTLPAADTTAADIPVDWWRADRSPAERLENGTFEYWSLPLDVAFDAADVVVAGTVTEVSTPFWNSRDGQFFSGTDSYTTAALYREVVLDVTRTLRGEAGPGSQVTFLISGAGPDLTVDGDTGPHITVGMEMVAPLNLAAYPFREGPVDVLQLLGPNTAWLRAGVDGLYTTDFSPLIDEDFGEDSVAGRINDRGGVSLDDLAELVAEYTSRPTPDEKLKGNWSLYYDPEVANEVLDRIGRDKSEVPFTDV